MYFHKNSVPIGYYQKLQNIFNGNGKTFFLNFVKLYYKHTFYIIFDFSVKTRETTLITQITQK